MIKKALALTVEYPKNTGLPEPSEGIVGVVSNTMKWLLVIFGALAIIAFVVSGIIYLTSAGDEDRMQKAKRAMIYAIIGVIVGLIGYIVVLTISDEILGGTSSK